MNVETFTITFADHWNCWIKNQGLGLVDMTTEVGLYDRVAFACTQDQLDALGAALTAHRETLTGTDKARATRALQRIHTSDDIAAWEAAAQARRAARRAAKSNA